MFLIGAPPASQTSVKSNGGKVPDYFFNMLCDVDRACKYRDGIAQCLREFRATEGRWPVVLDLGVGTGLAKRRCQQVIKGRFARSEPTQQPTRGWRQRGGLDGQGCGGSVVQVTCRVTCLCF